MCWRTNLQCGGRDISQNFTEEVPYEQGGKKQLCFSKPEAPVKLITLVLKRDHWEWPHAVWGAEISKRSRSNSSSSEVAVPTGFVMFWQSTSATQALSDFLKGGSRRLNTVQFLTACVGLLSVEREFRQGWRRNWGVNKEQVGLACSCNVSLCCFLSHWSGATSCQRTNYRVFSWACLDKPKNVTLCLALTSWKSSVLWRLFCSRRRKKESVKLELLIIAHIFKVL